MNFKLVFEQLLGPFDENNIRYALIGGFALGAQGVSRATVDIESLLEAHQSSVDWDRMKNYFSLFRLDDLFSQLKRKFGHAE